MPPSKRPTKDQPLLPSLSDLDSEPVEGDGDGADTALTATIRKYLTQIYRLADRGYDQLLAAGHDPIGQAAAFVSTSALADVLNVSPPAVNRMVTRLRELGMLEHEPYQGVRLTTDGRREALKQLRLHRIVEGFLVNVMGFRWDEIHDDADTMSRHLTEPLADRMWRMAGSPARCPHGEPIPTPDGELPPIADRLLTHAPIGVMLEVTRVRTREADRLEYLAALGLVPGARLEVIHVAPFSGPLQLRLGKEYRIVGHNLAEMLRVQDKGKAKDETTPTVGD